MRVIFSVSFAALGLLITSPAVAADKSNSDDAKERVVCKSEKRINSRFERRVCKSVGEWERLAQLHNDAWRERMSKPVLNPAEVP